jgi:hypothetical protein
MPDETREGIAFHEAVYWIEVARKAIRDEPDRYPGIHLLPPKLQDRLIAAIAERFAGERRAKAWGYDIEEEPNDGQQAP